MFSSVKFLSPIVTSGLPTPGPLAAAGAVVAVVAGWPALVALELLEEDLLLPHAASASVSAPSANAAEPLLVNAVNLLRLMGVIAASWLLTCSSEDHISEPAR
jgi:hypothetical protein